MVKLQIQPLAPKLEQQIRDILTYEGKIAAISMYKRETGCRLKEARAAVDRIERDIEPGQAP